MPAKNALFVIDSTPWTSVVICRRPGCQWRGFGHAKHTAYRQLADHLGRAHADARAAEEARRRAKICRTAQTAADAGRTSTRQNAEPAL